jgi:mediator of RNA polymerase II transcription subunit 31
MPVSDRERLQCDLEFIQNLCNASYLQFLAQNKYFDQSEFMNYLRYLQYWNEPEFKQLLMFPQCLEILDNLLSNESFRKELLLPQYVAYFHQQQGSFWMLNKESTPLVDSSEVVNALTALGPKSEAT